MQLYFVPNSEHINNHSLMCGIFPDALEIAKVVPVYKNGDVKCVSNYRQWRIHRGGDGGDRPPPLRVEKNIFFQYFYCSLLKK